ncbi:MAG TPA: FliA/WhiG family RNA polymerase sigma factor [Calditrichaeota bacterium]|nr:FliA/WhiG family RNA polymerase sigma factor [Calditrichota bacterium]
MQLRAQNQLNDSSYQLKKGVYMQATATAYDPTWLNYKKHNDIRSRQELVVRYLGLVKYVVRKMIKNYPQALEENDLYQIGILGLSEAIERFDPAYGIKFETYAIPRIKGSIIDELRKLDWIPRSLRAKLNNIREKTVELEQKFAGSYTEDEMANGLGIEVNDLHNWQKDTNSINIFSLDKPLDDTNKQNLYDVVEDKEYIKPDDKIEDEEMKRVLLKAIKKLPEKTRLAITLYYYEKLTFKEIGKILNVSESRISQIHSETVVKLKKEINKLTYA